MAESARVSDISAIKDVKAALVLWSEDAGAALTEAESEIRKTVLWLRGEAVSHWKHQVAARERKLAQAKAALFKKELTSAAEHPDTVLEEKAARVAKAAVEEAKEKIQLVKRWARTIEHEMEMYKAECQSLSSWLDADVPNAVAELNRMLDALAKYAEPQSLGESRPPEDARGEDGGSGGGAGETAGDMA